MSFTKYISAVLACVASTSAVEAVDWNLYFDKPDSTKGSQSINISWATAIGSESVDGYWYTGASRTPETSMHGIFAEDDNYTFGDATGRLGIKDGKSDTVYDVIYLTLAKDTTFGSLTFTGHAWDNSARMSASGRNINITRDLIRAEPSYMAFIDNVNILSVGRDIIINGSNFAIAGKQMFVNGDIKGKGSLYSTLNGSSKVRGAAGTFEEGLASPDVIINGVLSGVSFQSKADTVNSFAKLGGVTDGGSVKREAQANAGQTGDTISYFILTNTKDYTTGGDSDERNGGVWTQKSGKLALVMNGTASQSFTGYSMKFQGGVKVISGTLNINFNQSAAGYGYNRDLAGKINVKFATTADGTKATAFSHGKLEMLGGNFGSTTDEIHYGSFRFTDIVYTAGKINLRLNSEAKMDSLDLTSYYNIVTDSTSGSAVVTSEKVDGGTISNVGGAKVTFNFTGDLKWLIDDGFGEFDVNGGKGAKIIAWDIDKKTTLLASDFIANGFTSGEDYNAFFTVGDDGLYVKYVQAVPEASTIAAIFGALALGFASYRRRK